ncbi:hypothetical protein [Nocardioides immobilis]|nr:hypothetical protein [Nocardioides immobilis]
MGERYEGHIGSVRGTASRDLAESNDVIDREAADSLLGVETAFDIPDLLALLPAFEDEIEAGERRLRECVRLLRAHRATWREIGDALQVSRQAAWERFRTS